jgi:hypothetical protein
MPEPHQLGALRGGEAVADATVHLGLLDPVADRRLRQIEITADLRDGLPGRLDEGDHLGLVLVGELSTRSSSHLDLLRGAEPHIMVVRPTGSRPTTTSV